MLTRVVSQTCPFSLQSPLHDHYTVVCVDRLVKCPASSRICPKRVLQIVAGLSSFSHCKWQQRLCEFQGLLVLLGLVKQITKSSTNVSNTSYLPWVKWPGCPSLGEPTCLLAPVDSTNVLLLPALGQLALPLATRSELTVRTFLEQLFQNS
jgi:hypothetical protein